MTDIEIANSVTMKPITEIAGKLGIPADVPELYGKYKAKLPLCLIDETQIRNKHLILVSASLLSGCHHWANRWTPGPGVPLRIRFPVWRNT